MGSLSILIADDDQAFRETLKDVFVPRGFRALLASNGVEAVEIARSEKVDLALLDLHMPRMTGLEAAIHIRTIKDDMPWILLSAGLNPEVLDLAETNHAFAVLSKPVSVASLTSSVAKALSRRD